MTNKGTKAARMLNNVSMSAYDFIDRDEASVIADLMADGSIMEDLLAFAGPRSLPKYRNLLAKKTWIYVQARSPSLVDRLLDAVATGSTARECGTDLLMQCLDHGRADWFCQVAAHLDKAFSNVYPESHGDVVIEVSKRTVSSLIFSALQPGSEHRLTDFLSFIPYDCALPVMACVRNHGFEILLSLLDGEPAMEQDTSAHIVAAALAAHGSDPNQIIRCRESVRKRTQGMPALLVACGRHGERSESIIDALVEAGADWRAVLMSSEPSSRDKERLRQVPAIRRALLSETASPGNSHSELVGTIGL